MVEHCRTNRVEEVSADAVTFGFQSGREGRGAERSQRGKGRTEMMQGCIIETEVGKGRKREVKVSLSSLG